MGEPEFRAERNASAQRHKSTRRRWQLRDNQAVARAGRRIRVSDQEHVRTHERVARESDLARE